MIELADDEVLTATPDWLLEQAKAIGENGALVMIAGDPYPDLLADLDQDRVGRTRPRALLDSLHVAQTARTVAWTIAAYPNEGWAEQMFGEPDVERLWQAISTRSGSRKPIPSPPGASTSRTCASAAGSSTSSASKVHFKGRAPT